MPTGTQLERTPMSSTLRSRAYRERVASGAGSLQKEIDRLTLLLNSDAAAARISALLELVHRLRAEKDALEMEVIDLKSSIASRAPAPAEDPDVEEAQAIAFGTEALLRAHITSIKGIAS